jgi:4-hydroxy-2-oxoheptanedioate aldolase
MAARVGGWSMLAAPEAVEALAKADLDFVGLDLQHGAFAFREAVTAIELLDALGVPAYVRLSHLDLALVPRVLDVGAAGVILAMVEDAATVERVVAATRYQPHGDRSYGGQRYGLRPEPPDLGDVRPEVLPMVETRGALEAVEEIARVPGLAGLYVGPVDLSLALGEEVGSATWREAVERVRDAAHAAGIEAGMFTVDGADAAAWSAAGFDRIVLASDIALLRAALAREVSRAHDRT